MRYIQDFQEGEQIHGVYLVKEKRSGETKTGKPYETVVFQDKTGTVEGKIWDLSSPGIGDYDVMDFVSIVADVRVYNNSYQLNVRNVRVANEDEYYKADYIPSSENDVDVMYGELLKYIAQTENAYLKALLNSFFIEDADFMKAFKEHSAAKTIHHSYAGGLVEHTLHVAQMCSFFSDLYPMVNRDLLMTAAICHDIGKVQELSAFPLNDYTDEGQLIGHIVIGTEMITEHVRNIPGFPKNLENLLKHCILAHHGEYEYGSPKTPEILEAVALNMADNCDAKMETMMEFLLEKGPKSKDNWVGYHKLFEANIRKTNL